MLVEDRTATVVDFQVTGFDQAFLNNFNRNKINCYAGHPGFIETLKNHFGVDEVKVLALTISYKNLTNRSSYRELLKEGIIVKRDLPFLASMAMVGSLSAFHYYYKSTF